MDPVLVVLLHVPLSNASHVVPPRQDAELLMSGKVGHHGQESECTVLAIGVSEQASEGTAMPVLTFKGERELDASTAVQSCGEGARGKVGRLVELDVGDTSLG